jgi:hypothetical protein
VGGQLHVPVTLPPEEMASGTHLIRGGVEPRAGLHDLEKRKFLTLPGLEHRPLRRPARSQSLYRLRNRGSPRGYSTQLKEQNSPRQHLYKINVAAEMWATSR